MVECMKNIARAKEETKKYYAITTSMKFEKTVLVPVDQVEDIDEAIDLVNGGVEVSSIDLLHQDAECETKACSYADCEGILNLADSDAEYYQIVNKAE